MKTHSNPPTYTSYFMSLGKNLALIPSIILNHLIASLPGQEQSVPEPIAMITLNKMVNDLLLLEELPSDTHLQVQQAPTPEEQTTPSPSTPPLPLKSILKKSPAGKLSHSRTVTFSFGDAETKTSQQDSSTQLNLCPIL